MQGFDMDESAALKFYLHYKGRTYARNFLFRSAALRFLPPPQRMKLCKALIWMKVPRSPSSSAVKDGLMQGFFCLGVPRSGFYICYEGWR